MEGELVRLAKLMAHRGLCSRREAEKWIESGIVRVNGVLIKEQGVKVDINSQIDIEKSDLAQKFTVILNKPVGIVSHLPQDNQIEAKSLICLKNYFGNCPSDTWKKLESEVKALAVAGRLDRASRGLLLLSTDGRVIRQVTSGHEVEKRYRVKVESKIKRSHLEALNGEVSLEGEKLLPMKVIKRSESIFEFRLRQGKKHQIRRVCRKYNLNVIDLKRISIGKLELDDLPEGKWKLVDFFKEEKV